MIGTVNLYGLAVGKPAAKKHDGRLTRPPCGTDPVCLWNPDCLPGAGQPFHHGDASIIRARHAAIYEADRNMPLRKSHDSPVIKVLYDEYFGKPGSHKAHEVLHTHYVKRGL